MAEDPIVMVSGLGYSVAGQVILDRVDLAVAAGESLAITGPSGTGKTTLLMCLAGLFTPTSGVIQIGGRDVGGMSASARSALRLDSIGIVYQFGELLPELSPIDNVALPALLGGARRREAYSSALELLELLNVRALAHAWTATLSGGERQRVAVARALVTRPQLVLADEPTGSLDHAAVDAVADLLFSLPRRFGCALVVVTHNEEVATRADKVVSLQRLAFDTIGGR